MKNENSICFSAYVCIETLHVSMHSMLQKALTDQKKEKERIENMSDPNSKQV